MNTKYKDIKLSIQFRSNNDILDFKIKQNIDKVRNVSSKLDEILNSNHQIQYHKK